MIVEFNLSEKELREAVAEYVRKRYDAECYPKSAHFSYDGGDGPYPGSGYSASISGSMVPKPVA